MDPSTWDDLFRAIDNPVDWIVGQLTNREGRANEQLRNQIREQIVETLGALFLAYLVLRLADDGVDLDISDL